jgi:cation transport regulator ChaB
MKTLADLCKPRASVFDKARLDTVYNLDDLSSIHPDEFLSENYVTEGMRILLTEAFNRLEGKTTSASGTFLLSQSMGGGKTHNLIALGLLAKYPKYRKQVMADFFKPGDLGAVTVVAFSGRKTSTPFGIWGEIAEQLNRKAVFNEFYSPLKPPDPSKWVELLRGEPVLILLDELPPYFEAARAVAVGDTYLDRLTEIALANLLVAVNSNKLPRACVVITDLSGTAYAGGSASITQALQSLNDLEQEVNRNVIRIDPVKINTNEIYHILRTRIFEKTPPIADIEEVADAYGVAVDNAKKMGLSEVSPDQLKTDILNAYPFHPAIRDLYARFKENRGFQQTRALIRIMRLIVSHLWSSGAAAKHGLIGPHEFDLQDASMLGEIRQINAGLEVAVARDIAAEGGGALAQQIDGTASTDAQDIAKLIFLSSLSTATNPVLGLSRSEILGDLAAPERDVVKLRGVFDRLQSDAWYLHVSRDGKLFFKNVENLKAKVATYARNKLREQREKELRDRLNDMFKVTTRAAYQKIQALPALDQVQLQPDAVTLIVFRPSDDSFRAIEEFYRNQQYKNRVCFLTGAAKAYDTVLERAAELSAVRTIIGEMDQEGVRESDPQYIEATEIQTKLEGRFYQACRETFTILYYPAKNGLVAVDLDPKYVANEYKGEEQVLGALKECYKYTTEIAADGNFRNRVESKLWPESAKEVAWSAIRQRAASDPSWVWHHPDALDNLKDELVKRDIWREIMGYITRGPFEKPATSVQIQVLSRDNETGQATLRIRPQNGDTVYMEAEGAATVSSKKLDEYDIKTKALKLSFLCIDSKGAHATGEPLSWTNAIFIKHRFYQEETKRKCELKALPDGKIRFTTDGSGVETSGVPYAKPFEIPADCRVILAVAEGEGVKSLAVNIPAPQGKVDPAATIDRARAAVWKRGFKKDSTGETYQFLEAAKKHGAELGGARLTIAKDARWIELNTPDDAFHAVQRFEHGADLLKEFIPEGVLSIDIGSLKFDSGQQLLDMVADLKTELKEGEVRQ